ncbi:MAG: hypothetical protein HN559_18355 [Gemmatimonadetes bacterium]|nr:hypothetical protein [Gemmatimonadota bacterium]MBT5591326.1 hypothetical protein [Gemmatimonadota bacterium]MBT5962219.1 hypothetical protein [Gemmatimonadota bacterium]MBT7457871.1 hypothetical protein [Gemmatimonadota bacterium]MBT7596871.1 hypothetical protein [Gemmatimonadota bacterium]
MSTILACVTVSSALGRDRSAPSVPAWRGEHPGTAWLGADMLWRTREWLIFHMQDETGGGFNLDLTIRDQNIYMQGERPVVVSVIGPQDEVLARQLVPDDGITSGDADHREGIYDVFADYRYREWHRVHSPGGVPPGKTRSPVLQAPEQLDPTLVHVEVPDAGPGLYRVVVIASWDHYISLTPDRPIATGIHPGPGPLSVHGDRLAPGAYLWVPATTQHLGVSLTEEVLPSTATLSIHDETGTRVASRRARSFLTYVVDEAPQKNSVYRIVVTEAQPGAGLHIRGVPPVLAPDVQTARLIHGGMEIDNKDRHTFHHHQRRLDAWSDQLRVDDRADTNVAAVLAGLDGMRRLSPFFWYETRDVDWTHTFRAGSPFVAPVRSGWYGLGLDSRVALKLRPHMESGALPDSVVAAWQTALRLWAGGRWLMHMGETANQWTYNLVQLQQILQITGDQSIAAMMARDVVRLTTTGSLGTVNPDADYIDLGRTPAGYMAEQMGWDAQYGQEQEGNLARVWSEMPIEGVVDWWQDLYWLKTHMSLPKSGMDVENVFNDITSPTDMNFRTRYTTHKTGLPSAARNKVVFGDLWRPEEGETPARTWPSHESGSFVRSIDDMFHFVKTPNYYAIIYSGHRVADWTQFAWADWEDGAEGQGAVGAGGHVQLAGYSGPGYGAFSRKTTKVGAVSAISVPGVGPTLMAQNHNVWDSHVVWGRRHTPVTPVWDDVKVDPTIVCSGFVDAEADFDASSRTYRLKEPLLYAPLTVERDIRFEDERIVIDLTLTATGDVDLAELYLAIPYFADDRQISLFGDDLQASRPYAVPDAILTSTHGSDPNLEAQRLGQPLQRARAIDISGLSGSGGTTVILDAEYDLMPVAPVRYRAIASATGSMNVPLPTQLQAGRTHHMRYVIYSHGRSVDLERAYR